MIRVCIADDHEVVLDGLKRILEELKEVSVVAKASSAEGLAELLTDCKADILILDVNMPGCAGAQTVKNLLEAVKGLKIIVFSMYDEDSHAVSYLIAGAMAFISKKRPMAQLLEAVKAAVEGKRHITPSLAEYLFQHGIDLHKKPHESLSSREREVFLLLAQEISSTDIAKKLDLNVSTVNTYVQRIKTKLGVKTILQIVNYARENLF